MKLIAEGANIRELSAYENMLGEGEKGEVKLYVDRQLTAEELQSLEGTIRSKGVVLTGSIRQDSRVITVPFQKQFAPLLLIAGAIGALGLSGLIGWQLFRAGPLGIPTWMWIGGAVLIAWMLISSKKKEQYVMVAPPRQNPRYVQNPRYRRVRR